MTNADCFLLMYVLILFMYNNNSVYITYVMWSVGTHGLQALPKS